jgi:hypothetical protein
VVTAATLEVGVGVGVATTKLMVALGPGTSGVMETALPTPGFAYELPAPPPPPPPETVVGSTTAVR